MTAEDQVRLAGRLDAALLAAGLEVVVHRTVGARSWYAPAEPINVVGWLFRGNFLLREAAPVARPLVKL